ILAPTMQNAALGWLFSVFYYTYTLAQFAVGVNLDRYVSDDGAGGVDAKRVDGGRPAGRFRIAGRRPGHVAVGKVTQQTGSFAIPMAGIAIAGLLSAVAGMAVTAESRRVSGC